VARACAVRRASKDDSAAVAALLLEAFDGYRPLYTAAAFAATTPTADQILQRWDEGPVWIALQDDRPAGTVSAVPRGDSLYMRSMAVHPVSRGSGCGRLLLAAVEDFARQNGHARLELSTTPFLSLAIRLYERAGFTPAAGGARDLAGTPLFTMEKILAPDAQT
jgi:GNAT superfamily N-acetyltransferase